MFCTNCGSTLTADASVCPSCGKSKAPAPAPEQPVNNSQVAAPQPPRPISPEVAALSAPGGFSRFLNFEIMITPGIIKWIYIIGSVGIILVSLMMMFNGNRMFGNAAVSFFAGLIGGALSLVWFRVLCETMIVFFAIHKEAVQIKSKIK